MRSLLRSALDIREHEERPVYLLLLYSFFLGLFLATFDVTASSLFLDTFGEDYLPQGFIASGVFGVVLSGLFTWLQNRIAFSKLVIAGLVFILIVTSGLALSLEFNTDNRPLIFISFAMMLPLNSLALLGFYGIVSRSFNLKDEKRITGTADQGQMIALTLAFFTIPFIENILTDLAAYLFISAISILLSLIVLLFFYKSVTDADRLFEKKSGGTQAKSRVVPITSMISQRYLRLLSMFAVISAVVVLSVEYSFLSVASQQYPDPKSLANFLAYYGGILTIFSFILQTFISDRIMSTYGMRVSLLVLPILVGLIAGISSLIGAVFGTTQASESFIFFFLFVAMAKLFHNSLYDAFEDPITKTTFIPLDANVKLDIQSKISGFFKESGYMVGGGILFLFGLAQINDLSAYSLYVLLVLVYYGYLGAAIYIEYRKTLTATLQQHQQEDDSDFYSDYDMAGILKKRIKSQNIQELGLYLNIYEKMNPVDYQFTLSILINHQKPEFRKLASDHLSNSSLILDTSSVQTRINLESDSNIKDTLQQTLDNYRSNEVGSITQLTTQLRSRYAKDRLTAIPAVKNFKGEQLRPLFNPLLRDTDSTVREAALLASTELGDTYYIPLLVENLAYPEFSHAAASALVLAGDDSIPMLEGAFYRSGQSAYTMSKILQIYGRIASDAAVRAIWTKIDYPDAQIVSQVLYSLTTCGFTANDSSLSRIKQALEIEIGKAAWNIAALEELGDTHTTYLRKAMVEEIYNNNKQIYMLLSLMYDPQSVAMVKKSIESGTIEGLVYAIELLDVFLAEDVKPLLFPLIEDISQSERNFKLQTHFPREDLSETQVLIHIINRDYNYINRYTKACALYTVAMREDMPPSQDIVANLFNPDPFLKELAAYVLMKYDRPLLVDSMQRLNLKLRKELEERLPYLDKACSTGQLEYLLLHKVFDLKQVSEFKQMPGVLVMELLLNMQKWQVPMLKDQGEVAEQLGSLLTRSILLVEHGTLKLKNTADQILELKKGSISALGILKDDTKVIHTTEWSPDLEILILKESKFLEILSSNTNYAEQLLNFIKSLVVEKTEATELNWA